MPKNMVVIEGNVVRDAEIKTIANGTALCTFSIAYNEGKFTNGKWENTKSAFFDCEAWGGIASKSAKHILKGVKVLVTGRLGQSNWQDQDGKQRSRTKIVVDGITSLPRKQNVEVRTPVPVQQVVKAFNGEVVDTFEDDLPF